MNIVRYKESTKKQEKQKRSQESLKNYCSRPLDSRKNQRKEKENKKTHPSCEKPPVINFH